MPADGRWDLTWRLKGSNWSGHSFVYDKLPKPANKGLQSTGEAKMTYRSGEFNCHTQTVFTDQTTTLKIYPRHDSKQEVYRC